MNALSGVEDADMSNDELLDLLKDVLDRAATKAEKAAYNSTRYARFAQHPANCNGALARRPGAHP